VEGSDYFRFVAAFIFVCSLIGIGAMLVRHFGAGKLVGMGKKRGRLEIMDQLTLDAQHQAVILRRDGVEHLLIKGQGGSITVVESGFAEPVELLEEADDKENLPKFSESPKLKLI